MIYVCIPSYNEGPTVGLVLWKIRRVFEEFPREYQLLVADDGSTDQTAETLEPYTRVLPLTVLRHSTRQGYARTVEELLNQALDRSDRPKRDVAVLMHADFAHGPEYLPDFVKRLDSGADLVVGESKVPGGLTRGHRLVRRWAPTLLRRSIKVPGISDTVSGFAGFRLIALRNALKSGGRTLTSDGWAASAELVGRAARHARRIESVEVVERHDLRPRETRIRPWEMFRQLWSASGRIRIPEARSTEGAAS